mmetsp:Transcript_6581/g.11057  ORF Transcript_6581/g.11057 Transcript_6581/m.11057 type:complete len:600 (-) Transcript_6581:25-1824(-)
MDNQTLTRRATATDEDITNFLQRQPSLLEESISPTELPDTSHKRKQSDIALSGLNIGSDLRTTFELERIEQGVEEDDDQVHPLRAPLVSPTSYNNIGSPTARRLLFSFHPAIKNKRFIAAFMVFATIAALGGLRRSRGGSSDDGWGWEMVGDGIWFENEESDWLEYYPDPARLPKMVSTGPRRVDDSLAGMHLFTDVCVTNNIDSAKAPDVDTSIRGLIYFDKRMAKNPKRCVPCSIKAMNSRAEDKWGESSSLDSQLGHQCGMNGLHAMYASSVTDWNDCTAETENRQFMIRNKQTQTPSHAKNVHYFEEPTFLLSFKADNREGSLFETLFTYLPYWHVFRKNGYPFDNVFSKSVQGCLSHSRNWFCELTHQMGAFGYARETNWEETHATLYCFKNLYFSQQTSSDPGQVTKQIMDEFRDEIFSHFGLPRSRDRKDTIEKDRKLAMRILLYSGETWENLEKLVKEVTGKHPHVDFHIVQDLDVPIAEQARLFNSADAVVMASGDHMANSIFVPDDTIFAELSCGLLSRTSNSHFMELIAGSAITVASSSCSDSRNDAPCISCQAGHSRFAMPSASFEALVDDIVKRHSGKTSVVQDER